MFVYAFAPCAHTHPDPVEGQSVPRMRDAFVVCNEVEHVIALPMPDCPVSDTTSLIYDMSPTAVPMSPADPVGYDNAGVPVLAAVCLGTSRLAYQHVTTGQPWQCTVEDLTAQGYSLYALLSQLYGRGLVLGAYLDT